MKRVARRSFALAAIAAVFFLGIASLRATAQTGTPVTGSPIASMSPCAASTGASAVAGSSTEQSVSTSGSVTILLTDQGFSPSYVESTNGHPLTITLTNTGSRPHSLTVTHFNIDETLIPGETKTIVIEQPDLGDFPYVSDAPCDDAMHGLLVFYI